MTTERIDRISARGDIREHFVSPANARATLCGLVLEGGLTQPAAGNVRCVRCVRLEGRAATARKPRTTTTTVDDRTYVTTTAGKHTIHTTRRYNLDGAADDAAQIFGEHAWAGEWETDPDYPGHLRAPLFLSSEVPS